MSCFSLEEDGLFECDTQQLSPDPFAVLEKKSPPKPPVHVDQYSDISDDDFEIPCSQNRQ